MRIVASCAMWSIALAALLAAQGCARNETAGSSHAASAPEAAAATVPEATEAAEATDGVTAPAEADSNGMEPDAAAAPAAPVAAAAADIAAGEKVFKAYCATCHGAKGRGDGPAAAGLNPKPLDFSVGAFKYDADGNGTKGEVEDIMAIAHDGAAKHGGSPLMTAWPMIKPDQLRAVAEYVKSLHGT